MLPQSMAELLAENFHNTWAKKKKMEMEAKGESHFYFSLVEFWLN